LSSLVTVPFCMYMSHVIMLCGQDWILCVMCGFYVRWLVVQFWNLCIWNYKDLYNRSTQHQCYIPFMHCLNLSYFYKYLVRKHYHLELVYFVGSLETLAWC
jgi:hypothetical protein